MFAFKHIYACLLFCLQLVSLSPPPLPSDARMGYSLHVPINRARWVAWPVFGEVGEAIANRIESNTAGSLPNLNANFEYGCYLSLFFGLRV
jgi:hypothetical protein